MKHIYPDILFVLSFDFAMFVDLKEILKKKL